MLPATNVFQFAIQLVEEFFRHYSLENSIQSLSQELQDLHLYSKDRLQWEEIRLKCHLDECEAINTLKRPQDCDSKSTAIETIVEFLIHSYPHMKDLSRPTLITIENRLKHKSMRKIAKNAASLNSSCIVRPSQRQEIEERKKEIEDIEKLEENLKEIEKLDKGDEIEKYNKAKSKAKVKNAFVSSIKKKKLIVSSSSTPSLREIGVSLHSNVPAAYYQKNMSIVRRDILNLKSQKYIHEKQKAYSLKNINKIIGDEFEEELSKERLGIKRHQNCALCEQSFLLVNLPTKISFKCIMDLHKMWNYNERTRDQAMYRAPRCYDDVQVCLFCSQFITQTKEYRPNEEEAALIRKEKLQLEKLRKASSHPKLDPFSLPPLTGDDCEENSKNKHRHNRKGNYDDDEIDGKNTIGLAIVYDQQSLDSNTAMSVEEWNIISDEHSDIRNVIRNASKDIFKSQVKI